jgi:hypothetical protein
VTVSTASPTLITTPSPTTVTLGTAAVLLTDSADLENGYHPTGTITFTLVAPGGGTVDTETVTVTGNGTYTTPTGFTLPTIGTVTGTYQWNASYSGDTNNNTASDIGSATEQVTVSPASPTIVTIASPNVTLPTGPPGTVTLSDSALLSGGYSPTGSLAFTLTGPGGFSYTQNDTVSGNGTYTASTTLPTTGTVAGTYTWSVSYSGDHNNNTATDQGGPVEQTLVSPAGPTLTTTPSPDRLLQGVTLRDTAVLENGYYPTGTITFTLFFNGGSTPVHTETVTVTGNGSYTTPTGFTPGTSFGTYQWDAVYSGDANNNTASDVNNPDEQVTVNPPPLTLTTTPVPTAVTLGANSVTLNDTADLGGGNNPTGTITFALFHNGGTTPVHTETVTVNGDGTYMTLIGFTLPSSGMVTGTYQWTASYSGDTNNSPISDTNPADEQVTVSAASPTLAGGYHPTGTITFTLVAAGGATVDTETVPVTGNGTYTTPTGFTLPTTGTVTGTYQWNATYSGDPNNNAASDVNDVKEQVTVSIASPTLTTTPSPDTVTLGTTAVLLTDSADLENGYHPTGTITFTLVAPGGATVDTETATVTGNGIYTTPTGFTLPTTGTVTGTYQWNATYSGDTNNDAASDIGSATEQVTVSAANPTLITTPNPDTVTLGTTAVTLTDTADLGNGYHPTGTITFTLLAPGGNTVETETVTVTGNGMYTTPTGFTLPTTGTVTGRYQWNATYSGDTNNNTASDIGATTEQVTVSAASPTLTTIPSPDTVTLGTAAVLLTDSADLQNGYHPTGTITFTLLAPGGNTVETETVTVTGNGIYTTPTGSTLPTTGTVTGTYQWNATYSGDPNNNTASDIGSATEQVTVSPASPTLSTTPSPDAVTLGTTTVTLTDSATLAGGYHPSGTITFTLAAPGGGTVDTETVTVTGNGTYTTPTGFTLPTTGTVTGTYQWNATYSGDPNNNTASDVNDVDERVTVSAATPALSTTPSPDTVTLGTTTVLLTDTANLENGYHPTGTITFTLLAPGGDTVDTETVTVTGNGMYTTPTGFTLPTTGTVTDTYQWNATYSGDTNNNTVSDVNDKDERVTVNAANPTLSTTPSPATVTLGTTAVVLKDTADLENGYHPSGTITFTLLAPAGNTVDTETVAVTGNGTYTTPVGFTLPTTGTVTGTYQWNATYSGDPNNNTASDIGATTEQVTVNRASPTLLTIASPAITLGTTAPTLSDTAFLEGGYFPTGSIVFTLNGPDGFVYTQTDPVSGNGMYTASTSLPTTGTVAGTYSWSATYSGDPNNDEAADQGGTVEQTVVNRADPRLTTSPIPTVVTLGVTPPVLKDSATLAGGYFATGTITFTLLAPGGNTVDTETVGVSGNGTYTTPTGFTLPTTGTVIGTYQWEASYSGDPNNHSVSDIDSLDEQVTVTASSATLTTTPSPSSVPLGGRLQDVANLTGTYHATGSITFRLYGPGVDPTVAPATYTETVTGVNGDGAYHTTVGFVPTVTGTWHWVATYSGDANNNAVASGPLDEPVFIPAQADLEVTKTVDNPTPIFGTPITYTITVTNHGPDTATNVIVADPLPTGLTFIAAAASQGTYDAATGIWFVGTLANGASAVLHLTVQTAQDGPIVNNAVGGADQLDPDLSNNQATVPVTVQLSPDQIGKLPFLGTNILGNPTVDPTLFPKNQQFVIQLYGDLLHRQADALGLASWSDLLDNGAPRSQVVQLLLGSPEYLGDEVDGVYNRLLHRASDLAGRNAFVNFLESGGTVEQLESLIAGSPEYFQRRGGGTNDGFLDALYQDGLGRAVDAGGRAAWDQALASGVSRTQVATLLFGSVEYYLDLVKSDYATYLRRPADVGGLNTWVTQLLAGVSSNQILAAILGSDEYFTQVA